MASLQKNGIKQEGKKNIKYRYQNLINCTFSWARFVILNVLKEAGEGFLTIEETVDKDGNPDLLMTLDRTKISSVGMPAMGKFLEKLQVYKSIGDYESGKKMFDGYSQFDETWVRWREIIIEKQNPRRAVVQANSFIEGTVRDMIEYRVVSRCFKKLK